MVLGTKKDQPVFYNAIQKYGWDGFEHIIYAKHLTEQEAKDMEIFLIALYKTNCKKYTNPEQGYNMTDGGDGVFGHKHSNETKEKLREKAKERFSDPKNREVLRKPRTEETKRKLSEGHKGKGLGEENPFFGKHHTEETINKIKEAHVGISKPVVQLTTDGQIVNVFSSIHTASKVTGISRGSISFCLRGIKYKTAGGYKWKLLSEIEQSN